MAKRRIRVNSRPYPFYTPSIINTVPFIKGLFCAGHPRQNGRPSVSGPSCTQLITRAIWVSRCLCGLGFDFASTCSESKRRSRRLCAANVLERVGTTNDLENCSPVLRHIEKGKAGHLWRIGFQLFNDELLETVLLPTSVDSPFSARSTT